MDITMDRYRDILYLPHHVSQNRPRMTMRGRAAQFSSFAALTGHDEAIKETARLTDTRLEPDEDMTNELNEKLGILRDCGEFPVISVEFFRSDMKKAGGAYITVTAPFRRICEYDRIIVFTDGRAVPIDDIYRINGDFFDKNARHSSDING